MTLWKWIGVTTLMADMGAVGDLDIVATPRRWMRREAVEGPSVTVSSRTWTSAVTRSTRRPLRRAFGADMTWAVTPTWQTEAWALMETTPPRVLMNQLPSRQRPSARHKVPSVPARGLGARGWPALRMQQPLPSWRV
jgi:hypothetical protein